MPIVGVLIQVLIVLVIVALLMWVLNQFTIDPALAKIIRVVVVVLVVLWLLWLLTGLLPVPLFHRRT